MRSLNKKNGVIVQVWSTDIDMVCEVGKYPEAEANARLIAAAPDLLEVCKEFVRFADLPDTVTRGDHIRYQVSAIAAARDAIARATATT